MNTGVIYDLGFAVMIFDPEPGISRFRFKDKTYRVKTEEIDRFRHQLDGRVLVRVEHCERLNVRH